MYKKVAINIHLEVFMKRGLNLVIILGLILFVCFAFLPSKLDYTDRAKVLHGLSFAVAYKEAVGKYWKDKGVLPAAEEWNKDGIKVAVELGKSIVESIHVGQDGPGTISIFYTNAKDKSVPDELAGTKIVLTPKIRDKQLVWGCKGTLPAQYLPVPCR